MSDDEEAKDQAATQYYVRLQLSRYVRNLLPDYYPTLSKFDRSAVLDPVRDAELVAEFREKFPQSPLALETFIDQIYGHDPARHDEARLTEVCNELARRCGDHTTLVNAYYGAYGWLGERLGLRPGDLGDYLDREHKLLARLYHEARRPAPSGDELVRLTYQLALDARAPVTGPLSGYAPEFAPTELDGAIKTASGWRVRIVADYDMNTPATPPADSVVDHLSPLATPLLDVLRRRSLDAQGVVTHVEWLFGRQPTYDEAFGGAESRSVEFAITGDRVVRLWLGGVEVKGINRRNIQTILRYFCTQPGDRLTAPELEQRKVGVTNTSQAARILKEQLGSAQPGAESWFRTRPYGWEDGVVVRRRSS